MVLCVLCAGFSNSLWSEFIRRRILVNKYFDMDIPDLLPMKAFKPKNTEIPILARYEGHLSDDYWSLGVGD